MAQTPLSGKSASNSRIAPKTVAKTTDTKCQPVNDSHMKKRVQISAISVPISHLQRHKSLINRLGACLSLLGLSSPFMPTPFAIAYCIVMVIFIAAWLVLLTQARA